MAADDEDPFAGNTLDTYQSAAPGPLFDTSGNIVSGGGAYSGYVDPYTHPDYDPSTKGLPYYSNYSLSPSATSFGGKLQQLGSALGTLSGGAKPSQGTDSRPLPYPNVQAPVPPGSSMVGHPSAPISMSQLLQLLMQRRNAYMQAAANPRGAQPVTQALPTGQGLLGI